MELGYGEAVGPRDDGAWDPSATTRLAPVRVAPPGEVPVALLQGQTTWKIERSAASSAGERVRRLMVYLGAGSVVYALGASAWWLLGSGMGATAGFFVIAIGIVLVLSNLVALFVLTTMVDVRPTSRSYMAELVEAQQAAASSAGAHSVGAHDVAPRRPQSQSDWY